MYYEDVPADYIHDEQAIPDTWLKAKGSHGGYVWLRPVPVSPDVEEAARLKNFNRVVKETPEEVKNYVKDYFNTQEEFVAYVYGFVEGVINHIWDAGWRQVRRNEWENVNDETVGIDELIKDYFKTARIMTTLEKEEKPNGELVPYKIICDAIADLRDSNIILGECLNSIDDLKLNACIENQRTRNEETLLAIGMSSTKAKGYAPMGEDPKEGDEHLIAGLKAEQQGKQRAMMDEIYRKFKAPGLMQYPERIYKMMQEYASARLADLERENRELKEGIQEIIDKCAEEEGYYIATGLPTKYPIK